MQAAQVIPFRFEARQVRTLLIDDQPWFVAADVCQALAVRNNRDALSRLDDDEKGVATTDTLGGLQEVGVINESGLYSLILTSRKAEAKRFKKWVTAEVLPAIRKHGRYHDMSGQMGTLIGHTIGTTGFNCLSAIVDGKVRHLSPAARRAAKSRLWSQVHKAFSVVSAEDIPAAQLDSARNFIAAYALEGEWIGREERAVSQPVQPAKANRIRSRKDLSFTKRDAQGRFLNWFAPSRNNNWHEHYGLGETWFQEIVELAHHNLDEAYCALRFAGPEMVRYWNSGHADGFFDQMARWALAGVLACPEGPGLHLPLGNLGHPPREGLKENFDRAVDWTLSEQAALSLEARAWQESVEYQRRYYLQRRSDLLSGAARVEDEPAGRPADFAAGAGAKRGHFGSTAGAMHGV